MRVFILLVLIISVCSKLPPCVQSCMEENKNIVKERFMDKRTLKIGELKNEKKIELERIFFGLCYLVNIFPALVAIFFFW